MGKKLIKKILLFNPGPTNVSERVRNAIRTVDICHREDEFREVLLRVNQTIVGILNGEGTHSAVLFVSSGTGCNEAIISSIHGKAMVLNNGKYSDRLCEIVERYQIPLTRLKLDPLRSIDVQLVENSILKDSEITHILMVHHETTTGVLAPLTAIGELAAKHNKLLVVDGVSSIGGHPFDLKRDNIAFCSVSANKGLEGFPGVSFVIGRTEEIKKLQGKSRSFYFDLYHQWKKEQAGEMPFTPAVQLVFALDVALQQFQREGYAKRLERYQSLVKRMREGLRKLGFKVIPLPVGLESNILTLVEMPEKMDYWEVHDRLKKRGITIYSDDNVLKQRKFRVATLGSITNEDVDWFLDNLNEVMKDFRYDQ